MDAGQLCAAEGWFEGRPGEAQNLAAHPIVLDDMIKNIAKMCLDCAMSRPSLARGLAKTMGRLSAYIQSRALVETRPVDHPALLPAYPTFKGSPITGEREIFEQFREDTRIPEQIYRENLRLVASVSIVPGCVVECGVWRGGMSAGMAQVLGLERDYFLFDSFEGLPQVRPVDGETALRWQATNRVANCRTHEGYAGRAMLKAGVCKAHIIKGWFSDSLTRFPKDKVIAVLRLDADWYSSTAECLNFLYPHVAVGGIIIIDDYLAWDGCSKALHDFLSANGLEDRIEYSGGIVCYLRKRRSVATVRIPTDRR